MFLYNLQSNFGVSCLGSLSFTIHSMVVQALHSGVSLPERLCHILALGKMT